jgi:hypothetical protein
MSRKTTDSIRLTPEDKAALVKRAAKDNRTLAGLINKLMVDELARGAKA